MLWYILCQTDNNSNTHPSNKLKLCLFQISPNNYNENWLIDSLTNFKSTVSQQIFNAILSLISSIFNIEYLDNKVFLL